MNGRSANNAAVERLYQEIKARTLSCGFRPDECYYPESFSAEFGVSRTLVLDVLPRLTAEGLVIAVPEDGFIPVSLSEESVIGKYELTGRVLSHVLERLTPAMRNKLFEYGPIADTLNELDRLKIIDGSLLATYTEGVFVNIASLGDTSKAVPKIESANRHLRYVRAIESRECPEHVQNELRYFCELLLAQRCEELMVEIHEYHDRRTKSLTALLGYLRP